MAAQLTLEHFWPSRGRDDLRPVALKQGDYWESILFQLLINIANIDLQDGETTQAHGACA